MSSKKERPEGIPGDALEVTRAWGHAVWYSASTDLHHCAIDGRILSEERLSAALAALSSALAERRKAAEADETDPTGRQVLAPEGLAVAATTSFGCRLHRALAEQRPGANLLLSPYSVTDCLTLAWQGASGAAAEELGRLLGLRSADEATRGELLQHFGFLHARLSGGKPEGRPDMRVASGRGLWLDEATPLRDRLVERFRKVGEVSAATAPLGEDPEGARALINERMALRCMGRIPELLGPGQVTAFARLVAASAVFFKGTWAEPFEPERTEEQAFMRADGTRATMSAMRAFAVLRRHAVLEDVAASAVALPYAGGRLEMLVLLPERPDGLSAIEARLSPARIAEWHRRLQLREVDLALPRLSLRWAADLVPVLRGVGLGAALAPGGMAAWSDAPEAEQLSLELVQHGAGIDLEEAGAEDAPQPAEDEASAGGSGFDPPAPFRMDRPFAFVIREPRTNLLLFTGRIVDPSVT